MILCLSITIKKKTDKDADINANLITVNNFFTYWIKDISIKRYGDDIAILPINATLDIYRYSEAILKHLPKDALETFQSELLYSKRRVILTGAVVDRRVHNSANLAQRRDENIAKRITKFQNLIKSNNVYRIPLRFLVDVGLVNFPTAFNKKFTFNLEQNRNKVFEAKLKVDNIPTGQPDAEIYFHSTSYIQYEQIKLNDTIKKYVDKALQSKRVLRTGIKPTPFQKHCKSILEFNLLLRISREQISSFHFSKYLLSMIKMSSILHFMIVTMQKSLLLLFKEHTEVAQFKAVDLEIQDQGVGQNPQPQLEE